MKSMCKIKSETKSSISLLVCIFVGVFYFFFCLHPSHLCLGVSLVFSILSTTEPSSTLLSLTVRLVSRGSDLLARGRRSLSSLLTSGLLYKSVRWDWSLSSAAWRSCLSCSITLSLQESQHLSFSETCLCSGYKVSKYVCRLESLLLMQKLCQVVRPRCKTMVIFIL